MKNSNPYLKKYDTDLEFYFALSYEQDLENPVEDPSILKIIYDRNPAFIFDEIDINTPICFLSNSFSKRHTLKITNISNVVLTYITYEKKEVNSYIIDENKNLIKEINLNKSYIQEIINATSIDDEIEYYIEININEKIENPDYSCVIFHYDLTDEIVNISEFEKYNEKEKLKIKQEDTKISWNKLDNALYYEIYISPYSSQIDLFNNDCYLAYLKNQTNSNLKIIKTTNTFYEFENKNENLIVNVVALESKYKMRIIYEAFNYKNESIKNIALLMIIFSLISAILIVIIVVIICLCGRKKTIKENKEYNISMSEDLNININNENENELK